MKYRITATCALVLAAALSAVAPAGADEARLWLRYPAVSPDGKHIAFAHRGQIYRVDAAAGGTAVPLTAQGHYSHQPVWAPDSGEIAFASDINGDDDVYLTDTATGHLRRLTWSSNGEVPTSFTPDGEAVLFTRAGLGDPAASLQTPLNGNPHLYRIGLASEHTELVLPNQAQQAVWNGDGTQLLYSYNPSVDPLSRQHRVATNARQVWLYDAQSGQHTRLLAPDFDALNPVWGPGDETIYYLGEASGTLNVWRHDLSTGEDRQITHFDDTPARYLSVSDAGDVVFARGGTVWRIAAGGDAPQEVKIAIPEQRMDLRQRHRLTSTEEFVSSPDGAYHAVVANAEIFLLDRAGNTRQLTDTISPEKNVAFSPDGGLLVYAALRDGQWGIYGVDLQRGQVGGQLALSYDEVPLVTGEESAYQPRFSPDGSKLAYVAARREIRVLDLDTGETTRLFTPADYNTTYSDTDLWLNWSPDSRHLVVPWKRVPFDDSDAAGIVPADGSAPIRPLTQSIIAIEGAAWSADGTQVVAMTPMYGLRTLDQMARFADFYRVFMSDEARGDFLAAQEGTFGEAREVAEDDSIDETTGWPGYAFQSERRSYLEGRLTQESMIPLFFEALPEGPYMITVAADMGQNLSVVLLDLTSGAMQELASLEGVQPEGASYVPALRAVAIKTADSVVTIPLLQPDQRQARPFAVEHVLDPDAKRAAAFEQVWSDIKYKFYRTDTEGRDWDRIGSHYRAFLGSIASDRELASLIEEMFGELSASHLFVVHRPSQQGEELHTQTAALGFFTDYGYRGPGVRILDVLPGGPLDRQMLEIEPGDVIVSVDGKAIGNSGDIDRALDGLAGRQVAVGVVDGDADGGIERGIVVRPITLRDQQVLSHQRWIDTRRALVDERSRGCIAYQYLPEMDNDAYLATFGRLLASADTTKAALIDVRSNGGGNLHRQLIALLSGEPYAKVGREGRLTRVEPLDRWTKPSAVLVDTFAYSDGSIFPRAYQDVGIGKVVGDRLLNTGTGVDYVRSNLIPGLVYGIPVQPFRGMDDAYYENTEVVPDIEVAYDPNMADRGRDNQIEAAIDALMGEIGADSDCRAAAPR